MYDALEPYLYWAAFIFLALVFIAPESFLFIPFLIITPIVWGYDKIKGFKTRRRK